MRLPYRVPVEKAGTGVMLCLWVPVTVGAWLAVRGGEATKDLHITIAYLGKGLSAATLRAVQKVAKEVAGRWPVLTGEIGGLGRFNGTVSSGGLDVFHACVDVPGLSELRTDLLAHLHKAGVDVKTDHGFDPHVTLAYVPQEQPNPVARVATQKVTFKGLGVAMGVARTVHAFGSPAKKMSLEAIMTGLRITDEIVAKALDISEMARIARAETRVRDFLFAKWMALAARAVRTAGKMAESGKSPEAIAKAIATTMSPWAKSVTPAFTQEMGDIYRLARVAAHKKASRRTTAPLTYDTPNATAEHSVAKAAPAVIGQVLPSFDLADDDAAKALDKHQVLWIGEHYEKNVSLSIAAMTKEVMVQWGDSPAKAGALMREKAAKELSIVGPPGGFRGSARSYFEGLTANAATVARAHGSLRSFQDIGITSYTIVNPIDERTCPVCGHMDGKVFTLKEGLAQAEAELAAKKPGDVKAEHPWLKPKALLSIGGSKGLAGAGQALPPFHFRCRCGIDVSDEAGSWDALELPAEPAEPAPAFPKEPPGAPGELAPAARVPKPTKPHKGFQGDLKEEDGSIFVSDGQRWVMAQPAKGEVVYPTSFGRVLPDLEEMEVGHIHTFPDGRQQVNEGSDWIATFTGSTPIKRWAGAPEYHVYPDGSVKLFSTTAKKWVDEPPFFKALKTPTPPPAALPPAVPKLASINTLPARTIDDLKQIDFHVEEPTWANTVPQTKRAYGGIVFDDKGRVLLREPTNHFDGYVWTFAKGKIDAGEHPVEAALREVLEETGHKAETVGLVPGTFKGGTGTNNYFILRSTGMDEAKMLVNGETASVIWATPEEAAKLISQTTNALGKERDLAVLKAATKAHDELLSGAKKFTEYQPSVPFVPPATPVSLPFVAPPVNTLKPDLAWPSYDDLAFKKNLGGSTGAAQYVDPAGARFVVKTGNSAGHILEEHTTDNAYRAAGVSVPEARIYTVGKTPTKVSKWIDGETLNDFYHHATPGEIEAVHRQLQQDFALDAVLGNRDVIGMGADNVMVSKGVAYRIDNGSGLRYRAQGSMKPAKDWSSDVREWIGLRNKTTNPVAAKVYGSMTDEELLSSLHKLFEKEQEILKSLPSEVEDVAKSRFDALRKVQANLETKLGKTPHLTVHPAPALPAPAHVPAHVAEPPKLAVSGHMLPTNVSSGHFKPAAPDVGTVHVPLKGKSVIWDGSKWVKWEGPPPAGLPVYSGPKKNPKVAGSHAAPVKPKPAKVADLPVAPPPAPPPLPKPVQDVVPAKPSLPGGSFWPEAVTPPTPKFVAYSPIGVGEQGYANGTVFVQPTGDKFILEAGSGKNPQGTWSPFHGFIPENTPLATNNLTLSPAPPSVLAPGTGSVDVPKSISQGWGTQKPTIPGVGHIHVYPAAPSVGKHTSSAYQWDGSTWKVMTKPIPPGLPDKTIPISVVGQNKDPKAPHYKPAHTPAQSSTLPAKPEKHYGYSDPDNPAHAHVPVLPGEFLSLSDAKGWANEQGEEWEKKLTHSEKVAIKKYTGSFYDVMNRHLRKPTPLETEFNEFDLALRKEKQILIDDMNKGLSKGQVDRDIVLFRGMNYKPMAINAKSKIGSYIDDKGFASTSISEKFARNWQTPGNGCLVKLKVPKGTRGAYVGRISSSGEGEGEFIMPQDITRFKIVDAFEQRGSPGQAGFSPTTYIVEVEQK